MVQAGNRAAFAVLVRGHQQRAYFMCRAVLDVHEDADEAVQVSFVEAFRAIVRHQSEQPFGPWLDRIVSKTARDLKRRRELSTEARKA